MGGPDYRLLFESVPGCNLVLDPALRIVAVSNQFLDVTTTRRDELLGREIFEVFPDDPADPEPSGVSTLRVIFERVLAEGRTHVSAVQRYPIRRPAAEGGAFEPRFWRTTTSPIPAEGQVAYLLHHVEEMTEMVRLEHAREAQDASLKEMLTRSERYVQLLDTAPDATVIVGEDGRIQLVNRQTENLFGYKRAELLGQPLDVLIPERFRPGHGHHVQRYFAHPDARPMGSGLELFGRCKDGTELPIEVSLSPQRGEHGVTVSAAIRDISERKRLEAAARVMGNRLASSVESIQDAFALFDADERLVLCNSVYRRLLHDAMPGQLVGKSFEALVEAWADDIAFSDARARERFLEERLTKERPDQGSSFDVRLRDGRTLRVAVRRTADGGIVKTIWDLTEEEARAEDLRQARAAAEAASAAKSEFLASMSHELRTPLNAILGFAQLLVRDKREPLSQRHIERANYILQGGEHLLRLIDDVLDLARIEAGRVSITTESVSVQEVLDEVHRTLEPLAARYGVELKRPVTPETLPRILADRTRYAQILMNFASNAAKYNQQGGTITFRAELRDAGTVRVSVVDTGVGIPRDKQDKLFQPFQRAGQETGPIEGTGIGLVITKQLAGMMGGSVGFHSVEGKGSSFWVDMPVDATIDAERESHSVAPSARRERESDAPVRVVLYVEDNPANVSFMLDLMSSFEDIELVTVPTAELGIELARARRPAAILMDINLPGMSGLDALRVLRGLPETADVPVIALTAAASERDRQRGIEAGFFRYLTKPVKVDELWSALELLLAR